MSKEKHTCRWWLTPHKQCGRPTQYQMVRDDDQNLVRKYATFCDEHAARATAEHEKFCSEEPDYVD